MRKGKGEDIEITRGSDNVFSDLGFPDADDLKIKAELTRQLCNRIKSFGLTQVEAAKRLGLKQPDVSKLMRGLFIGFSTERLIVLLTTLDIDIEIILRPASAESPEARGKVRVLAKKVA